MKGVCGGWWGSSDSSVIYSSAESKSMWGGGRDLLDPLSFLHPAAPATLPLHSIFSKCLFQTVSFQWQTTPECSILLYPGHVSKCWFVCVSPSIPSPSGPQEMVCLPFPAPTSTTGVNEFLSSFHLTPSAKGAVTKKRGWGKMKKVTEGGDTSLPPFCCQKKGCGEWLIAQDARQHEPFWTGLKMMWGWAFCTSTHFPPTHMLFFPSSMNAWLTTSVFHYSSNKAESDQATGEALNFTFCLFFPQ